MLKESLCTAVAESFFLEGGGGGTKCNLGKVKLETVGAAVAPHASMLHVAWLWDISGAARCHVCCTCLLLSLLIIADHISV